jgi:hypothetical protein
MLDLSNVFVGIHVIRGQVSCILWEDFLYHLFLNYPCRIFPPNQHKQNISAKDQLWKK